MKAGDRIGPYELCRRLGEGGMGVVWEARDRRLGRGVALKFLPQAVADAPESRARFEREARAASTLTHANICVLYDIGDHDGRPYLVMELLQGQTLGDRLVRGPLPDAELVRLARNVAAALAAAHEAGVLHRDLKPANIFIGTNGAAKILDFGVAKALAADPEDRTELTSVGTLLGTVKYMSPEQALGQQLDPRSDLFSLGVVLYEAATGRPPFAAPTAGATLNAVVNATPEPLGTAAPELSPDLVGIIERLLSKSPGERFASATDLSDGLDCARLALSGSTTESTRPGVAMASGRGVPSIAVLPFANLSPDPDSEFFSDGLAEELITSLSRLSGLRVAARSSSFRFKGKAIDACEAGRQLGVATVLEGGVRRAGERVRITAQLIDVASGYQKWSERFDGTLDDIFQIQEDTASAIVRGLEVEIGGTGPQAVMRRHTDNREAYELYLKGRYHWARRHKGGQQQALDCFQRAVVLDPDYALAWVGVADAHWSMIIYAMVPYAESLKRADRAVQRALALAPELAEVHGCLGSIALCRHDWQAAEAHYRRSIDLDPNYWFAPAYLAMALGLQLRREEAAALADRAVLLERENPFVWGIASLAYLWSQDYETAVEFGSSGLELDDDSLVNYIARGLAHAGLGNHDQAISDMRCALELGNRMAFLVGCLAYVLGNGGHDDEARQLLGELERRRELEHVADICFFLAYLGIDSEAAHAAGERDLECGGTGWQTVLGGRVFPDLLERAGLPAPAGPEDAEAAG